MAHVSGPKVFRSIKRTGDTLASWTRTVTPRSVRHSVGAGSGETGGIDSDAERRGRVVPVPVVGNDRLAVDDHRGVLPDRLSVLVHPRALDAPAERARPTGTVPLALAPRFRGDRAHGRDTVAVRIPARDGVDN